MTKSAKAYLERFNTGWSAKEERELVHKPRISKRNTKGDGKFCAHCGGPLVWTTRGHAEHPSPVCEGWKGSGGAVKREGDIHDVNRNLERWS